MTVGTHPTVYTWFQVKNSMAKLIHSFMDVEDRLAHKAIENSLKTITHSITTHHRSTLPSAKTRENHKSLAATILLDSEDFLYTIKNFSLRTCTSTLGVNVQLLRTQLDCLIP